MMTMKYNTVLFDLDGTLLDTLQDLCNATNYALRQYGCPERSLLEIRRFLGNGAAKLIERSLPDGGGQRYTEVLETFREYYAAHCEEHTRPYDGIDELLRQLSAAGVRMAVVSNKPDHAVKKLCRTHFEGYVRVAVGDRDGIRRKPAPDAVLAALKELGSSAKEAVYVGDSEVDIQTAANSGLDCITVTWGFRDPDFLLGEGAAMTAATPQEVYGLIRAEPPYVPADCRN